MKFYLGWNLNQVQLPAVLLSQIFFFALVKLRHLFPLPLLPFLSFAEEDSSCQLFHKFEMHVHLHTLDGLFFVLLKKPHAGFLPPTLPHTDHMKHLVYQLTWFSHSGRMRGQGSSAAFDCEHWGTGPAHRFINGWKHQNCWICSNMEELSEEEKEAINFNKRDTETMLIWFGLLMSLLGWTRS